MNGLSAPGTSPKTGVPFSGAGRAAPLQLDLCPPEAHLRCIDPAIGDALTRLHDTMQSK